MSITEKPLHRAFEQYQEELLGELMNVPALKDVKIKVEYLGGKFFAAPDAGREKVSENPNHDSVDVEFFQIPTVYRSRIIRFHLTQLPGCCGVCLSYHAATGPTVQNKGLQQIALKYRERIAWAAGYTVMLATVRADNETQRHILAKYGYKKSDMFINRRTANEVYFYHKILTETNVGVPKA